MIVILSGPSYVLAAGVRRLVFRIDVCGYSLILCVHYTKGRLSDGMVTRSILLQIDDSQLGAKS